MALSSKDREGAKQRAQFSDSVFHLDYPKVKEQARGGKGVDLAEGVDRPEGKKEETPKGGGAF